MQDRDAATGPWAESEGSIIAEPRGCAAPPAPLDASPDWLRRNLPLSLDAYEKAALERALVETWGDASRAARLLGIGRSTFYRKAGKHGINVGEIRSPAAVPASVESPGSDHAAGARPPGVGPTDTLG